jgi:LysM repeat protein
MSSRAGNFVSFIVSVVLLGTLGCNPTPQVESLDPNTGSDAGGNTVTINGANFHQQAQVEFGGQTLAPQWISRKQLSVVAPPGQPGTVSVTVVNPNDRRARESVEYTYVDQTPPAVSAVTPTDGRVFDAETGYKDAVQTGINTVSVSFSEKVQSAEISVAYEALPDAIKKGATGTVNGAVTVADNTATFTSSDGDFRAARKYTVTATGRDAAGNRSQPHTVTFTIATPQRTHYYTVRPGDSLPSIAARPDTYDDEAMWTRILRVNQDYHEINRNRVKPGLRLVIHW